ncbi:MAG: DUF3379 family protein [Woeseiaceae bacterium]|nr:DUF3379 family protein [Woeseiaceae bacterium]
MTDEYDNDTREFDLKIAKALQIDVPELVMPELPEIEAGNVATLPVRRRSMKPLWFAVAATVVLATSISLRMSDVFQTYDSLADEILAHLDHEPGALRVTDIPVPDARLARVVPASIAEFDRDEALITYAQPCIIRGKTAPHLVVQGERGPVTIILMPEVAVAETTPIDGASVKGVILPVGDGSIAIIGDRDEVLAPIQKNVVDSVTWTT